MQIDHAFIHNLAADMFWRMADACGVGEANRRVLATEGRCLLDHPYDDASWRDYPIRSLPDDTAARILDAVAAEALGYTHDQQNMIGQVYLEDRESGRSPTAAAIDTRPLASTPAVTLNRSIERLGRLCLRHPLPAVVFADRIPSGALIQVADTVTALGFDLPMFLNVAGSQWGDEQTAILTGYFLLPAPDVPTGDLWNHVVQNSHRSVEGTTLFAPDGDWIIRYTWPAAPKPKAWWRR